MADKIDRLFKFDMYPADWLLDTGRLTAEQCGVYCQIVMLIYARRGPIENDPEEIARKIKNCSIRKARSIIELLLQLDFIQLSDQKITQRRAESELSIKRNHLEHSAKGGRTKAENEFKNRKNKGLNSSANTKPQPAPSPSPSPSPIVKAKKEPSKPVPGSEFYKPEEAREIYLDAPIIKLTFQDFYRWWKTYCAHIPDEDTFYHILHSRDAWLQTQPRESQARWFMSTQAYLKKLSTQADP